MSAIETVQIASDAFESGFCIINKDEFDPEKHVLFNADAPTDDAKRKARAPKTNEA